MKKHNTGVDCARCIAMLFIVIGHVIGHGGIIEKISIESLTKYSTVSLIEYIAVAGVDVFALLSGYVGFENVQKRYKKIASFFILWSNVLIYSLLGSISMFFWGPMKIVTFHNIIQSMFPITGNNYWYFSCYFGVVLLKPLLNECIRKISKKTFKTIIIVTIPVFFYAIISSFFGDVFGLQNGFSFLWLAFLYCIGAGIKKWNIENRYTIKTLIFAYCMCGSFMIIFCIFSYIIKNRNIGNLFVNYISPTVLGMALCIVLIFSSKEYNEKFEKHMYSAKVLNWIGGSCFSVYLISDNNYIRKELICNRFIFIAEGNAVEIILMSIGMAVFIFLICILIDVPKHIFFNSMKYKNFSLWIAKKIDYIFSLGQTFCNEREKELRDAFR